MVVAQRLAEMQVVPAATPVDSLAVVSMVAREAATVAVVPREAATVAVATEADRCN